MIFWEKQWHFLSRLKNGYNDNFKTGGFRDRIIALKENMNDAQNYQALCDGATELLLYGTQR